MLWMILAACSREGDVSHPSTTTAAPTTSVSPADQAAFDALVSDVEDDMAAQQVPGAQVAMVLADGTILTRSLGTKGIKNDAPVTPDTRFRWASLSKSVAGAVLVELADEGTLSLDAPIEDVLPGFVLRGTPSPSGVTLDLAMTHRAGIPDLTTPTCDEYDGLDEGYTHDNSPGAALAPPGAVWNYSNIGFTTAGAAAEAATGEAWADLVRDRIFDPLGMSATFDLAEVDAGDHATGWGIGDDGERFSVPTDDTTCVFWIPPAGIWGTGDDLGRWMRAILDDHAEIRQPLVETRQTPDTDYGYGMYVTGRNGRALAGHDGRLAGFESAIYMYPDDHVAVGILYNGDAYPGDAALTGLDRLLGLPDDDQDWTTDPSTWGRYAGTWDDPDYLGTIDVTFTGDGLLLTVPEAGTFDEPMTQAAGDTFSFLGDGQERPMTFWFDDADDPDGPPRWWVFRYGVGERVDPLARTGWSDGSARWGGVDVRPAWAR